MKTMIPDSVKRAYTSSFTPRTENGETGTFAFAHGTAQASRIALVNHMIASRGYRSYLEIGVRNKSAMHSRIAVGDRVSVDPDPAAQADHCLTSDDYFAAHDRRFDIVFIDGLHTGEQVRKDIANSLRCLNEGGAILLHDMNPPTAFHAREEYEVDGTFPAWNGTSWEGFAWHRKHTPGIEMAVVDTDWGVGFIQSGQQTPWTGDTEGYDTLDRHRAEVLNLVSVKRFLEMYP